jgi:hypothetical protein
MACSLIGPLRLLDGDFPDREFMQDSGLANPCMVVNRRLVRRSPMSFVYLALARTFAPQNPGCAGQPPAGRHPAGRRAAGGHPWRGCSCRAAFSNRPMLVMAEQTSDL